VVEYATYIHQAGQQADTILSDLLEWARAESGQIAFSPEALNLGDVIDTNLAGSASLAAAKGIHLVSACSPELTAFGDPRMIDTILRNLLGNAVKFTAPKGRIQIITNCCPDRIEIAVRDNGTGMTADEVAALFGGSEWNSTAGTNGEIGTGLGLRLCRTFAARHGAELTVESEPGVGSTFAFSLPRTAP
jgi:signal transduction histidine kinase